MKILPFAIAALLAAALPAQAQEAEAPTRYRVALGRDATDRTMVQSVTLDGATMKP